MAHPSTCSPLLDTFVRHSAQGNQTRIDIAAPPAVVWAALYQVSLRECRTTRALSDLRTLPGRLTGRGAYGSNRGGDSTTDLPLLESMKRDRFVVLSELPDKEIILGVIGQFWKPGGGTDAPITDAAEFVSFDTPGYVKAAINFCVEATPGGCVLMTETRCVATDPIAARRFGVYWVLIGWGSKVIRRDILTATRLRAESTGIGSYRWHDAGLRQGPETS